MNEICVFDKKVCACGCMINIGNEKFLLFIPVDMFEIHKRDQWCKKQKQTANTVCAPNHRISHIHWPRS